VTGPTVAIRPLGASDAAAWLDLRLRALREHPRAFLASEEEDAALGVDGIAKRLSAEATESIVLGACGNVGRALVAAAVEAARAMPGVERLALSVDVENAPARALYEAMGFAAWGTEHDAFRVAGTPLDEMHMALAVTRGL